MTHIVLITFADRTTAWEQLDTQEEAIAFARNVHTTNTGAIVTFCTATNFIHVKQPTV